MTETLIIGLYIACELIANVTAAKPVALGGGIVAPAAVSIYALTFTLIDLINDRLGKQGARYVIYTALMSRSLPGGASGWAATAEPEVCLVSESA